MPSLPIIFRSRRLRIKRAPPQTGQAFVSPDLTKYEIALLDKPVDGNQDHFIPPLANIILYDTAAAQLNICTDIF